MARVAVAYVEVRPDTKSFSTQLKEQLNKLNPKVDVKADTKSAEAAVRKVTKVVADEAAKQTEEQGKASRATARSSRQYVAEQEKDAKRLAKYNADQAKAARDRFDASIADIQYLDKLKQKSFKDEESADKTILTAEQKRFNDNINRLNVTSKLREKYLKDGQDRIEAAFREDRRLFLENEKAKVKIEKEVAKQRVAAMSASLHEGLVKQFGAKLKSGELVGKIEAALRDKLTPQFGEKVAAQMARGIGTKLRQTATLTPDLDLHRVSRGLDKLASMFGKRSMFGIIAGGLTKAMSTIVKSMELGGAKGVKAFGKAFKAVPKLLGGLGSSKFLGPILQSFGAVSADVVDVISNTASKSIQTTEDVAAAAVSATAQASSKMAGSAAGATSSLAASTAETSGAIVATVAEMTAETGGAAALAVALGVVAGGFIAVAGAAGLAQAALGVVLAVVIPLVASIEALVAQFAALASVAVGSVALLPGMIGAAAAAFGPLLLVADKFQKLMEDTTKHTGELFVTVEHLKNAIFAVMTAGLFAAIGRFVDTTLPKLFGGIDSVAKAWNKLFLTALKLVSTQPVLDGINTLLAMGAQLVGFFTKNLVILAPALMRMATAAGPALTLILDAVTGVSKAFATWITSMTSSGQMATFLDNIATILTQLLGLAVKIAPLMAAWIIDVLPFASQFVALLTTMVGEWTKLATSAAGQKLIQGFFAAMNKIMIAMEPLVEQVVTMFLQFGPTLAELAVTAVPVLMILIDLFNRIVAYIAPALLQFLRDFGANLQDPANVAILGKLVDAITNIMEGLGRNENMFIFLGLLTSIAVAIQVVIDVTDFLMRILIGFDNLLIEAFNKALGVIGKMAEMAAKLPGPLRGTALELKRIADEAKLATIQTGNLGGAMVTVGNNGGAAVNSLNAQMTAFANSSSWQTAIDNAGQVWVALQLSKVKGFNLAERFKIIAKAAELFGSVRAKQTSGGSTFMGGYSAPVTTAMQAAAKTAGKKTAAGFISTFKPAITKLDPFTIIKGHKAYDTGREIAVYIAKGITSGTKNINKVAAYIQKTFGAKLVQAVAKNKAFWTKQAQIAKAIPDLMKNMTSGAQMDKYLASRQGFYTNLLGQIKDFKSKAVDALTSGADLVGYFGFIPTPAEVKARLDAQLAQIKNFTSGLAALQQRGLSKELAATWLQAGYDQAGNLVEGLKNATPAELAAISGQFKTIGDTAATAATAASDQYFGIGQATVEGYISGIQSMRNAANAEMKALIDFVYQGVKKKLKISSPSKLYGGLGVDTMGGYIEAVVGMTGATVSAVNSVFDAVANVPPATLAMPTVTPAYATPGAMVGIGETPAPQFDVRVFVGDRELTDIIRTEVTTRDTAQARALLAGRRGG